ncbi:MAG: hypothetical protein WAW37_07770 [Syntrophobacteraceae bacterium]
MAKFVITSEQLKTIIERTIDLFLEYQYKHGFDEPRARAEAVMDVIGSLKALKDPEAPAGD